jgi:hypothetical protein
MSQEFYTLLHPTFLIIVYSIGAARHSHMGLRVLPLPRRSRRRCIGICRSQRSIVQDRATVYIFFARIPCGS